MTEAARKMRALRARLRARGLRPIQLWVPDTRLSGFIEEARRQSALVSRLASEQQTLDWVEAARDTEGWDWS
ncbi:MAG: antitoxin MazE family protein [Nitrospirota bacterium]|nr:antitoxin MazE family protein [Nitrospirota bacterium]